jgi:tetratricopeptide (TPR) repeat protein
MRKTKALLLEKLLSRTAFLLSLTILMSVAPVFAYNQVSGVSGTSENLGHKGLLQRGFDYLSRYELEKAIGCFAPLVVYYSQDLGNLEKRRKCVQTLMLIGRSMQFDENDVAAEQAYGLAHNIDAENKVVTAYLANALSRMGRWDEAEALFKPLSGEATSNLEIATALASYRIRSSDGGSVQSILFKSLENNSQSPSASYGYWLLANIVVRQKVAKEAAAYLRRAASRAPTAYLRKLYIARAQLCEENRIAAKQTYRQAGELLPGDPSWLIGVSKTIEPMTLFEHPDAAFKETLAAVQCKRFSSQASYLMAHQLSAMKRAGDAHKCLEYTEAIEPFFFEVHLWNARIYRRDNELAFAERELRKCLALNPHCADAWIELADLIATEPSPTRAIETLTEGVRLCPHAPRVWAALGKALITCQRWGEARKAYDRALTLMPGKANECNLLAKNGLAEIYSGIGTCEYRADRLREAVEAAKLFNKYKFIVHLKGPLSLVHVRPDRIDFEHGTAISELEHEALADMLYETRQFDGSVKEYRLALAEDPDNLDLHCFLFVVLRETNDWAATMSEDFDLSNKLITKVPSQFGNLCRKVLGTK